MGCQGSKTKKNKKKQSFRRKGRNTDAYKVRTGFKVTKESINDLSEDERDEYALFADMDEYFARDELPKSKYVTLLKAIKDNKTKEYTNLLK